jgi:hypothetical protein
MAEEIQKMIVVPIDGSENVLRTLDCINLFFGPEQFFSDYAAIPVSKNTPWAISPEKC